MMNLATTLTYATAPWRLVVIVAFAIGVLVYEFWKTLLVLVTGYVAVSGIWWLINLMVGEA